MARKHSKHGGYQDLPHEEEAPAEVPACWLCGRPTGKTIVWAIGALFNKAAATGTPNRTDLTRSRQALAP